MKDILSRLFSKKPEKKQVDLYDYRKKPERRPYTFEELKIELRKHGGYVVTKDGTVLNHIELADSRGIFNTCSKSSRYGFNELLHNFVWLDDGSPCGILDE